MWISEEFKRHCHVETVLGVFCMDLEVICSQYAIPKPTERKVVNRRVDTESLATPWRLAGY